MAEWLKIIILGIVEGLTEFLPISSTGHLIVGTALLDFTAHYADTFVIFIQLGAVLAVLAYYWRDIFRQVRDVPHDRPTQYFWLAVLVAIIPMGVIGFLLRDTVKSALFSPQVVAISLIIGGILFIYIERRPAQQATTTSTMTAISLRQALLIGLIQCAAIVPGVSRSGASIIGGMQAGLSRQVSTQFSFYLAIPTLGGATIIELLGVMDTLNTQDLLALLLGAAVSALVAWVAIGWLLRFVASNTFTVFGYYRIVAGVIILAAGALGWLG